MSSATMSTATIQSPRCAVSLADKDTPSFHHSTEQLRTSPPDSIRTASPKTPSPKSPPTPLDKPEPPTSPEQPKSDKVENDSVIDRETFDQIRELDEDGEFMAEMIDAFFEQATKTFDEMDEALEAEDLLTLHSLGHFLKGSSAALGVTKVKDSCEQIQHYGVRRDEELRKDLSEKEALDKISDRLKQVKTDYAAAKLWLEEWQNKNGDES